MVIAGFQILDKLGRACFFQETFLLAVISIEVVFKIFFLTFSNANIQFAKKKFLQKTYIVAEALPTIFWVKFIDKKKFAKTVLNKNVETFIVHMTSFTSKIMIYPACEAQILLLLAKKVTVWLNI